MSVIDKIDNILNEASSKKPKDIKSIWDIGEGKSMDRYTIIFDPKQGYEASPGLFMSLGFAAGRGGGSISQWGEAKEGKHLGKKLKWEDLPKESQEHVIDRIKE